MKARDVIILGVCVGIYLLLKQKDPPAPVQPGVNLPPVQPGIENDLRAALTAARGIRDRLRNL